MGVAPRVLPSASVQPAEPPGPRGSCDTGAPIERRPEPSATAFLERARPETRERRRRRRRTQWKPPRPSALDHSKR
ncbi:unnamed protein product [Arctogadus glacialis]